MSHKRKPCRHCPYRRDVKPFLHPERGEELAYLTLNEYNEFFCHKTLGDVDDDDGEFAIESFSKVCAGFLTLACNEIGEDVVQKYYEGFKPSYDVCYTDAYEMADAYENPDEAA